MKQQATDDAQAKKALGPSAGKGYYLFHDGDRVTEIKGNDSATLFAYYNKRLQENQQRKAIDTGSPVVSVKATDFWE